MSDGAGFLSPDGAVVGPVATPDATHRVRRGRMIRRFTRNRGALIAFGFLVFVVLVAIFAPWLVPHDPETTNGRNTFAPPLSDGHILGTDNLGRDHP